VSVNWFHGGGCTSTGQRPDSHSIGHSPDVASTLGVRAWDYSGRTYAAAAGAGGWDDLEPGPPVAAEPYAELVMLRDATGDDWPDIYPFFAETVAAGDLRLSRGPEFSAGPRLWMQPPPWRTIVAVEGDQVLGTAIVGPNRPGRGSHVATASFMVAPAAQGRGVGRALGEHVLELACDIGYRAICVWGWGVGGGKDGRSTGRLVALNALRSKKLARQGRNASQLGPGS
jgi:GNAT superfamily N-acetyltransferase